MNSFLGYELHRYIFEVDLFILKINIQVTGKVNSILWNIKLYLINLEKYEEEINSPEYFEVS